MAEEGFKRKLAAILSADVEGYSRLMDDDEEATVRTITSYRNVITDLTQQFRGRVVDSPGDNILADFTSVVDAVNCAVEIQKDLAERNDELPDNRKMQFRIGVNLGDVIEEDGRIYGDGVNIAARVESLAEAGGICISGRAHDQVENKLGLVYEDLGKHEVKNISRPIQVYRVLSYPGAAVHRVVKAKGTLGKRWRKIGIAAAIVIVAVAVVIWQFYTRRPTVEPASVEKMAFPLPEKPSIAVLPFDNMSGDPNQEFFSDGLTEEITTALSKSTQIFVIARNSSFTYKGKPVKVQQVSEELGVRYVLEGSVRKDSKRVRITAQLIDAIKGIHLWAERYDRDLEDVFAIQDDITKQIIAALHVKLTIGEDARILAKTTNSLDAYLKYLQAREYHYKFTKEDNHNSRRLVEEAISIDPEYGSGYALLGATHMLDAWLQATDSPKKSLGKAIELSHKAIDLGADAHSLLGFIYGNIGQHDKAVAECQKAVAECQKAVELSPNSATARTFYGLVLNSTGRFEEAVSELEQGLRLDPFSSGFSLRSLGVAYSNLGRYQEAIAICKKAIQKTPNDLIAHLILIQAYSLSGQQEGAEREAAEVLRINPNFSLDLYAKRLTYKNKADFDRVIAALRKAGLPEHPPLPLPDKPSIAVLAFDNLSGDPEQEYFADGLAEEIITALASIPKLFVIARNSSFTYKGKPVKVQQVSRELGVRYVLEGSVRKAGDRVRITAQLIDARKGNHQWAESYDRKLEDIFVLQDEIAMKVITELQVELTDGERTRMATPCSENLKAYLKCLNARDHYNRMNKQDIEIAQRLAEEAVAIDPGYACAYSLLGGIHIEKLRLGSAKSPKETMATAYKMINKAIALNPSLAGPRGILSLMYRTMGQHEKALTEAEKSLSLNHHSFIANVVMGNALRADGRTEEGLPFLKQATRIDPFNPNGLSTLGFSYILTGQYREAIQICKKSADLNSENIYSQLCLASVYSATGREEEANAAAAEVIKINSRFSTEHFLKSQKFKKKEDNEFLISTFRKAGLPE